MCAAEPTRRAAGLRIAPPLLQVAERDALRRYPEECCGILVGRSEGERGAVRVLEVIPVENRRRDRPGSRYSIDPVEILRAQKRARSRGLEIVGYYHSHPDLAARPSRFDRETAWPDVSYLILSLRGRRIDETRSWRLAGSGGELEEEPVECG